MFPAAPATYSINLPILEDAAGGPYWDDDLPNVPEAQLGLFVNYDDLDLRSPCLVQVAPAMLIASASGSGFTGLMPGTPTPTRSPKREEQDSGEGTLPGLFRGTLSPLRVGGNEGSKGPGSPLPKSKTKMKPKSKPRGKKFLSPKEQEVKDAAKKKKMENKAHQARERKEKKGSNHLGKRVREERETDRGPEVKGNRENLKGLEEREAKTHPSVLRRSSRVAGSVVSICRL